MYINNPSLTTSESYRSECRAFKPVASARRSLKYIKRIIQMCTHCTHNTILGVGGVVILEHKPLQRIYATDYTADIRVRAFKHDTSLSNSKINLKQKPTVVRASIRAVGIPRKGALTRFSGVSDGGKNGGICRPPSERKSYVLFLKMRF